MQQQTFQYTSVGQENLNGIKTDLYHFKCLFKQTYILEVEIHQFNIYFIKFFKKNHRHSRNRYSLVNAKSISKDKKAPKNFLIIMNTIIEVMILYYNNNKLASFGFMGAPTVSESSNKNKDNINEDNTVKNTKRYNIYSIYVKRYFNPTEFDHISIPDSSCYLVKSIDNLELTTDKVESFFNNYIELYC